ncbi:hypothetical protein EN742_02970 [Mesorhizobium sp. M4A.F.Ca.ET.020.02.1.1]|uniref:hypothetical protein n=1 Tax=Mesorhizobium sp. M4A.F.Ca.ET.020.02.1.1 TaxID=2496652 RepID=UPI000FD59C19|nr:hypothetical protein [Mesorhizobium sp. M4A.F.Ca.ET.020.02.1.1]RVD44207.1 hypothetical protein EN742_02970 [Mesorhizobium sp. M4A.F.Ca.ET.020.02.1.1]
MDTPGVFSLGEFTITAAGTQVGEAVTGLEGMLAALLQLRLAYGSGGTAIKAYVQCSADQGTTWYDVACIVFGVAGEVALLNLSALTPKTTAVVPGDGALADDTAVDGLLTDRMRLKLVSTGTYAGQTVLSARLVAR